MLRFTRGDYNVLWNIHSRITRADASDAGQLVAITMENTQLATFCRAVSGGVRRPPFLKGIDE